MGQEDADDGADVEKGADELLRRGRNVPSNLGFLVLISIDFEKPWHGLKACNRGRVIAAWCGEYSSSTADGRRLPVLAVG